MKDWSPDKAATVARIAGEGIRELEEKASQLMLKSGRLQQESERAVQRAESAAKLSDEAVAVDRNPADQARRSAKLRHEALTSQEVAAKWAQEAISAFDEAIRIGGSPSERQLRQREQLEKSQAGLIALGKRLGNAPQGTLNPAISNPHAYAASLVSTKYGVRYAGNEYRESTVYANPPTQSHTDYKSPGTPRQSGARPR
ncbi:hypothetical protein [Streptomyces sp. 049-1]|uniref:hypothetical protein n=1 Tax=Streptomyces sp. 049-1 TaxID=2789264 RepID=UPI0039803732